MADRQVRQGRSHPGNELGPELRRVVEGIVGDPLPTGLVSSALERARQTVVTEAETGPKASERSRVYRATIWSLAAAASIGAVVLAWHYRPAVSPPPNQPIAVAMPQTRTAIPNDAPTVWAYREALGQSPEAMEAMLERDARQTLRPEPQSVQASAFSYYSQPML